MVSILISFKEPALFAVDYISSCRINSFQLAVCFFFGFTYFSYQCVFFPNRTLEQIFFTIFVKELSSRPTKLFCFATSFVNRLFCKHYSTILQE